MAALTLSSLAGGVIKSIQRGEILSIASSTNATVSAVVMNRSFVTYSQKSTGNNPDDTTATCRLTTTTNLNFSRRSFSNALDGAWELIEYE